MNKKRGQFFTIDAILAAGIFFIVILLVSNSYVSEPDKAQVSFMSQDTVRVFTNLRVDELDNDYVQSLIGAGVITRANNTILEQIGEFWAEDEIELAEKFASNVTDFLVPARFGFGIYVNGEEIYLRDKDVTRNLISSRKIISGIEKEKPTEGFTSKVVLSGIKSKTTSAYSYFGGYEGDGNLVKRLILPNSVMDITNVTLEVDAAGNFDLYFNGIYSGTYVKGSAGGGEMLADKFAIDESYYGNFRGGTNFFTINFTSEEKFIAGGFLKVRYTTSSFNDTTETDRIKYWLPGIDGFINYYSAIYSVGNLENMEIFLDFWSNHTTFMKIGNTTVYNDNPDGAATVLIDNSALAQIFLADGVTYSDLSKKTIPVRFGVVNTSIAGNADVMLVTDVSGSMERCSAIELWNWDGWVIDAEKGCYYHEGSSTWRWGSYSGGGGEYLELNRTIWVNNSKNYCSCRWHPICNGDQTRLGLYKDASKSFVDILFNISGNKMGLVDYSSDSSLKSSTTVYEDDCSTEVDTAQFFSDSVAREFSLTSNEQNMINNIDATETWWDTCICCGINKAVNMLNSQSSGIRNKSIVVMSDGAANIKCPEQGTGNAKDDAIQAAQDACAQGITVYTVGFGGDTDEVTLQSMACGGGTYSDATDPSQLEQVYEDIAGAISSLSYITQQPSATLESYLYPTSYIQLNYSEVEVAFGKLPLSFETDRFGNNVTTGTINIPANTMVLDAKATSYSGDKWTDNLVVNSNQVYDLSGYGSDYSLLGDPYPVDIPIENLNTGSNSLLISTGINPSNNTGGSPDNKAIYTLLLDSFVDFTSVVARSNGCNWEIDYDDGTSATVKIPKDYTGANVCNFASDTYDDDDSINLAVITMLNKLDLDNDKKLEFKIDEDSLSLESLTIINVPSLWGPIIVEMRVWE